MDDVITDWAQKLPLDFAQASGSDHDMVDPVGLHPPTDGTPGAGVVDVNKLEVTFLDVVLAEESRVGVFEFLQIDVVTATPTGDYVVETALGHVHGRVYGQSDSSSTFGGHLQKYQSVFRFS